MQAAYPGNGGKVRRYACIRGRDLHSTGQTCQTLGGGRLEKAVAEVFLEAVTPAGMSATAGAIRELEDQYAQLIAGQRLAPERAEFEAQRAERQFDACEPENRLVARTWSESSKKPSPRRNVTAASSLRWSTLARSRSPMSNAARSRRWPGT